MKTTFLHTIVCTAVLALNMLPASAAAPVGTGPGFQGPVGLQLYSLREQFKKDVPGTLDKVRDWGFKHVELAGTYGMTPEAFKALLDARGLKPVAGHFAYEKYRDDVEAIAKEAKALGLEYVGCAWIPHPEPFDEKTMREAIGVFNKAGEALAKHGLKFYYHIHGYEFQPKDGGTLFDLMMKETKPEFVCFQMDVFWAVHPGQDPVKLFEKYGNRWVLTHLKDMKKGTPTGVLTGHSDVNNNVPIGTGQIDFPALLKAAKKAGVKWHFLEDESAAVEQQIPQTLRFLESIK
jgi:sugar phosphate isomerase/epimerase